jgi:hypothetical protein
MNRICNLLSCRKYVHFFVIIELTHTPIRRYKFVPGRQGPFHLPLSLQEYQKKVSCNQAKTTMVEKREKCIRVSFPEMQHVQDKDASIEVIFDQGIDWQYIIKNAQESDDYKSYKIKREILTLLNVMSNLHTSMSIFPFIEIDYMDTCIIRIVITNRFTLKPTQLYCHVQLLPHKYTPLFERECLLEFADAILQCLTKQTAHLLQ